MESESIGDVLNLPPAAARRLTREASRLHDRLEPDLEREEVTYPPAASLRSMDPGGALLGSTEDPAPEALSRLDVRDRELLDRVVHSWQRADHGEAPSAERQAPAAPAPHSAPPPLDTLRPGDVEGLDADACELLARIGIITLEELVDSSVDDLVTRAGLPYTRARTLQFRAGKRRRVAAHRPVDSSPFAPVDSAQGEETQAPGERFSPSDRPLPEPDPALDVSYEIPRPFQMEDDGDAAGPFA